MAKRDYYEVLSVPKGASKEEIKKAYRKVAVANHPDRNPGNKEAEDRFKEATEAYEVLADDQKRQAYDQFGFAGVEGMGGGPGQGGFSAARDFEDIFGDFSGVFESFFGGGGSQRGRSSRGGPARGADLRYDLAVSFIDAVFGKKVDITYEHKQSCEACKGTGAKDASGGKKTCSTCGGVGQVRRSSGFFSIASVCPSCNGEGFVIENPCRSCNGAGVTRKQRTLKVTIPPGMDHGKRINLSGQGDAGPNGGPAGDLYVFVHVEPHEYFERDGYDVYCMIPISITQAALGAEIRVPTLDDKRIKLKVPSGTQSGKVLRIRSEGVPHLHNENKRGDMYIKINVRVPEKLSSKAKNLLKEVSDLEGEDLNPRPVPLSDIRARGR
ncbi:MAG: molecular chaperone DnaJ [Spirochaetaceae bacterium]|nr:MAG: molecular chaperone DnaJ [Spirochaetaceae bacterium]